MIFKILRKYVKNIRIIKKLFEENFRKKSEKSLSNFRRILCDKCQFRKTNKVMIKQFSGVGSLRIYPWNSGKSLTPFRISLFGALHGRGGEVSLHKSCLGRVITWQNDIPKIYKQHETLYEFCTYQCFLEEIAIFYIYGSKDKEM